MTLFRDFIGPDWKIFTGNMLMLTTCAFYLAWWGLAFKPGETARRGYTGVLIAGAVVTGICAITLLSLGIAELVGQGKGIPLSLILIGAVAAYIVLLATTKLLCGRPVTSELLIMIVWAAVELAAIGVLRQSGRFSVFAASSLGILVALATVAGLVCYVLYYRLDETAGYVDGFIPLAVDAGAVAAFLAAHALA
jgi:hypothetical protein